MAWPTDPLASVTDLENAVGGTLKEWTASDDPEVRTMAGLAITQGHNQVIRELNVDLPDLFRNMNSDWLETWVSSGYSLTTLETVVANLPNPTILKDWEVCVCLFWLANSLISKFQVVSELQVNVMSDQRKFWGGADGRGGQALITKKELYAQLKIQAIAGATTTDFDRVNPVLQRIHRR